MVKKVAQKPADLPGAFIEAGLKAVPKSKKAKVKKAKAEPDTWTDPEVDRVVLGEWPVEKTGKRQPKKVKKAKDNGEKAKAAKAQAAKIIEKVKKDVSEDHALGHKVKELRDTGMAWWQIAYQLNLPGSGPNVASGKTGAARARALYKKTFGDLPGDVARRSTKASRAAAAQDGEAPVRKQIFTDDQLDWQATAANEEILARVRGHEIRWVGRTQCSDGSFIESEREARVHPDSPRIERVEGKPTVLHFREYEKGDRHRQQQWRSVRLVDVYDIRR